MENQNDEITISEAKKVTAELKASILKLDVLNQNVTSNIIELKDLNSKLEDYTYIISKFESLDEKKMTTNYASYLAFLSKKIDDLFKNKNLSRIEKIIDNTNYLVNLSIVKVSIIVAVITTGINFLILK